MCGIVGYLGEKNTKEILLDGLKELEYRGYDSAGIAVLEDGSFSNYKAIGKLINLEDKTKDYETKGFAAGIGHTRWATHGKPTELNAHPHVGDSSYVVHNGIIENYANLKKELIDSYNKSENLKKQIEGLKSIDKPIRCYFTGVNPEVISVDTQNGSFKTIQIDIMNLNHISFTFSEG